MSQLGIGGFAPVAAVSERGDRDTTQRRSRGRKHPAEAEDAELGGSSSDADDETHKVDDTA